MNNDERKAIAKTSVHEAQHRLLAMVKLLQKFEEDLLSEEESTQLNACFAVSVIDSFLEAPEGFKLWSKKFMQIISETDAEHKSKFH